MMWLRDGDKVIRHV